ncbi:MAG: hypothetical protein ABSA57_19060 [Candidatus Acidiferrales bacterium]
MLSGTGNTAEERQGRVVRVRTEEGCLLAITSVIYLIVLVAFFIVQHDVLIAGKITGSVIDWSPEKPGAFGMRPVNGEWNGVAHERHS